VPAEAVALVVAQVDSAVAEEALAASVAVVLVAAVPVEAGNTLLI
jgi:hypothetical protein